MITPEEIAELRRLLKTSTASSIGFSFNDGTMLMSHKDLPRILDALESKDRHQRESDARIASQRADPMPDDPTRAAFERTIKADPEHLPEIRSHEGEYLYTMTAVAWRVWQAAIAWERERPAREHAALPKCPACGKPVDVLSGMCQPCAFSSTRSDYDRVPLTPAGSVQVKYVDGGTIQPLECDDAE